MTLADFPQVRAMPVREKLLMVEEIWQSIGDSCDELEVSEAEKRELDSRWARFEQNPSRALTLEQFDELIKTRRG